MTKELKEEFTEVMRLKKEELTEEKPRYLVLSLSIDTRDSVRIGCGLITEQSDV